jgi:lysophospholipase L1-like esterase
MGECLNSAVLKSIKAPPADVSSFSLSPFSQSDYYCPLIANRYSRNSDDINLQFGASKMKRLKLVLIASVWATTLVWQAAFLQAQTATGSTVAASPAPKTAPSEKWETTIREFEKVDRESPPPNHAILFIGSSTIRLWKSLKQDFPEHVVINRGFGGSQMVDSMYFTDRIVIPYKPKQIIVYAGSNDLAAGKTPEQVLNDFKAFVTQVRDKLPETKISFMSIGPSPARWSQAEKQQKANRLIKEFIDSGKNLDYIHVWDQFLGADGKPREEFFVADKLHNSDSGYKIRVEAVRPYLK